MIKVMKLSGAVAILATVGAASAAEIRVAPGASIQDAVNRAQPGDVVLVEPGEYKQSVYIDKPKLTLRGLRDGDKWAVLDGGKTLNDGVIASGHGTVIEGLYVKGYKGNGVMTQGANNFKILNNRVDAAFYGIFPQYGRNGLVKGNVVTGAEDAGIYVGMSDNLDVVGNETYGNVIGVEFENSRNGLIEGNTIHDNSAGVVLSLLPGLPVKDASGMIIRANTIANNNHENFAPASSIAATVPPGSGILVVGVDKVTVEANEIRGNVSAGVLVADLISFGLGDDPKLDPYPDDFHLMKNTFKDNGHDPQATLKDLLAPVGKKDFDLVFAGKGQGNCIDPANGPIAALGARRWGACDPAMSTASVTSAMLAGGAEEPVYSAEQRGRMTYLAVCTGCHAYDSVLHGPSVQSIAALYAGNPDGLIAFVKAPTHKRQDFPEMPSQAYLGDDTLKSIADYVLNKVGKE